MILPLTCNTQELIASTVDGNYTYVRYASDDSGTDFSEIYNNSIHTHGAVLTSDVEIPSPSASDFTGKWIPLQKQYTYFAFATSATGTGFSQTYTGAETYAGIINSSTEITSLQASDFTGSWYPMGGSTSTSVTGEDLLTHRKTGEKFPFTQFLIKNEEMDNTLASTECNPITVSSIDTSNHYIIASWLPNIDSIYNPATDSGWVVFDLDSHSTSPGGFYSGGFYKNVFLITGGSYSTKTLNYTWIGTGIEANTIAGHRLALWNPDVDGFTRYTGNPILEASDFSSIGGTFTYVSTMGGIFKRTDNIYVLILVTAGNSDYRTIYATSSDLLTWTPVQTTLFISDRPSWTTSGLWVQGSPIYLEDEEMYVCSAMGIDTSGNWKIGWVKFNETFTNYTFSPNPTIDTSQINDLVPGWHSGYGLATRDDTYYSTLVENNGIWYNVFTVIGAYHGTHTGTGNSATLTDSAREVQFVDGEFGTWGSTAIYNITDGSSCTSGISVTSGVVSGTLSGGSENDWDTGDEYLIFNLTTRRSFYAVSDSPYGPWKHYKAIHKNPISNDGALGNSHMEPPHTFIYKGVVHCFIGQTAATDFSGVKGHRIDSVYRLDSATGEFIMDRKSPVFSAWQYANDARTHTNFDWEMYHTGGMLIPYVDETNNRMYFFYTGKDASADSYKIGVAYKDLTPYK